MKKCAMCGLEKDDSCFNKDRSRESGLHTYCKDCVKIYNKQCYEKKYANRPNNKLKKSKEQIINDYCHRCGVMFHGPSYDYSPTLINGYNYCESCVEDLNK